MTHLPFRSSVAALAIAGTLAAACGDGHAAAPSGGADAAIPVRTAAVGRGPVQRPVHAAGTVAAKDEWELAFKVGGLVGGMNVQQGDRIRKGQILATLDSTEVAAAVRQARERFAKARRDGERARFLRASGSIARVAAEDAETAAAVSAAALESAEFDLRNATLVAPDDGWVDRRLAEPGEVVAAGHAVLHVSGVGRGFVVRVNVPGRDVLGLAPGDAAAVTLDAWPAEPIPARITEIARSAARGTGTYQVELLLDRGRAPRGLLAGLTGKVDIERTVHAAVSVPLSALLEGDGASGAVFVVDGERARRVQVRVAFLQGGLAVLAAGLDGIDRVVTDGATRLADGARVHLVP